MRQLPARTPDSGKVGAWIDRRRRRARVRARRSFQISVIVAASVAAGAVAVAFAKACDWSAKMHHQAAALLPTWALLALLPVGFALSTWITRRVAPQATGSGIPQVVAAAAYPAARGAKERRLSVRAAALKMLLCVFLLACGASIGREGPTVQIAASIVTMFAGGLRRGPGRRALAIGGGAAGVAAAFNTPIAGVVFGVEELAKGFDRRTNTVVILMVVAAGVASYALAGDYAYFGQLQGSQALLSAWLTAPIAGVACGAAGGLFVRLLTGVIGHRADNPVARFRVARPIVFAFACGLVAAAAALASGGLTYGTGYAEARGLLAGHGAEPGGFSAAKWGANLVAACSGAPGGIFSPALATGAGIGAWLDGLLPFGSGRDAIVLGMACYLAGVVQAPLTSAVILMEMTRDPMLVGPLLLGTWIARAVSARFSAKPVYHALAEAWR
ncbi:MAG: chloride channel protein [Proteobacteria bacterium]|nr:chloride channel protein [Pseudomonadota bacterium]